MASKINTPSMGGIHPRRMTAIFRPLREAVKADRYWHNPSNPTIIGYATKSGDLIPGSTFGGGRPVPIGQGKNHSIEAEFQNLTKIHEGTFSKISSYLKYEPPVNLLLFKFGIKAAENKFDPLVLFEDGIQPLLKQNHGLVRIENIKVLELIIGLGIKAAENKCEPWVLLVLFEDGIQPLLKQNHGLVRIENIKVLELIIGLGIKAAENKCEPWVLFEYGINPLLKQNPDLARIENIDSLEKFGELMTGLGIKAAENNFDPLDLFEDGIHPLLKQNHGLARIENIKVLELIIGLGIKAAENEFDPRVLFECGINPLLKQNPDLARIENIDSLEKFGELMIDMGIKAAENKIDPLYLFRDGIFPLLGQNPDLARIRNIKVLELIISMGIKAAENEFDPRVLFEYGINPLLKQNPDLARIENIDSLEKFGELMTGLGIKAAENNFDPKALFHYGINRLLDRNPDLARIGNVDSLKKFAELITALGIKAAENIFDPRVVFECCITNLLEQNPDLAKIENIDPIKKFGELMISLGIKAAENKFDPRIVFEYGIEPLLKQNPGSAKIENINDLAKIGQIMLDIGLKTSERNRERMWLLTGQCEKFSLPQLRKYLGLAKSVFTPYPRLAYLICKGIFDAVDKKILPKDLDQNVMDQILYFIGRMNSFEPVIFAAFKKKGDKFLDDILEMSSKILTDKLDADSLNKFKQKHPDISKNELTLALIQTRIPLSGASFVSKKECLGLFKKMAECGDLRGHVPDYWRGQEIIGKLSSSEMRVREGVEIDKEGKIKAIVELLRSSNRPKKEEVLIVLKEYIKGDIDSRENKHKFLDVFLRYGGTKDLLGEKTARLGDKDFYTLRILEEIFKDKDNLIALLAGLLEEAEKSDPKLLEARIPPQAINDQGNLAKVIKKNLVNLPSEERKIEAASKMLAKYKPEEVKAKLLPLLNDVPDIQKTIEAAINMENKAVLSKRAVIEKILADPLASIRHEMGKYEPVEQEEKLELGFRVVKGIPYGIWGLNAGVCIATDVELWKNPSFKLIAIEDKNTHTTAGFIHVFETEIDGRKVMTIPGIEPSVEFLNNVDAAQLYDQIETALKEFARLGRYEEFYLPTSTTILSNRMDIQEAVQKKKYLVKKLGQAVNWNNDLGDVQPYPFDEVYAVK